MKEMMGGGLDPEEKNRLEEIAQDKENAEELADYIARHPEQFPVSDTKRETGPEIATFEALVASFESAYSLDELYSINEISTDLFELFLFTPILETPGRIEKDIADYERMNPPYIPIYKEKIARLQNLELSPEESRIYKLRMAARRDIDDIITVVNIIKERTDVSPEQLEEINKKYDYLAKAVGFPRDNKVIHS